MGHNNYNNGRRNKIPVYIAKILDVEISALTSVCVLDSLLCIAFEHCN